MLGAPFILRKTRVLKSMTCWIWVTENSPTRHRRGHGTAGPVGQSEGLDQAQTEGEGAGLGARFYGGKRCSV